MALERGMPKEDEGPTILAATLTVTIVALLTFITRLYVRVKLIRNVGWDVSMPMDLEKVVTNLSTPLGLCHDGSNVTRK